MKIIEETYKWAYPLTTLKSVKYIVLHHEAASGSTAQEIHKYHLGLGWSGIAYHLYIRKDGTVYRGRPIDKQGGHCKGYNGVSVGVCFEGNFENEQMSEAQKIAGLRAVAYVLSVYPDAKIVGHKELCATACPGRNFPLNEFKEADYMSFIDTETHWAKSYIEKCVDAGLMKGKTETEFDPDAPITRAEVATVFARLLDKMEAT